MLSRYRELRGIEDQQGRLYLWPAERIDHITAAAVLGIPFDPETGDLTGKAFYVRSMRDYADWITREDRWTGRKG